MRQTRGELEAIQPNVEWESPDRLYHLLSMTLESSAYTRGTCSQVHVFRVNKSDFFLLHVVLWSQTVYVDAYLWMRNSYVPPAASMCALKLLTSQKKRKFRYEDRQEGRDCGCSQLYTLNSCLATSACKTSIHEYPKMNLTDLDAFWSSNTATL